MIDIEEKLSDHFKLGEMIKTKYQTPDGNLPPAEAVENLRRICQEWLEELRFTYNILYVLLPGEDYETSSDVEGIVISQGYRSPQVSKALKKDGYKPSPISNHLTGCAVDIRCAGLEQALRYMVILLDMAHLSKKDFDELYLERHHGYWIHLAVRPTDNRGNLNLMEG